MKMHFSIQSCIPIRNWKSHKLHPHTMLTSLLEKTSSIVAWENWNIFQISKRKFGNMLTRKLCVLVIIFWWPTWLKISLRMLDLEKTQSLGNSTHVRLGRTKMAIEASIKQLQKFRFLMSPVAKKVFQLSGKSRMKRFLALTHSVSRYSTSWIALINTLIPEHANSKRQILLLWQRRLYSWWQ